MTYSTYSDEDVRRQQRALQLLTAAARELTPDHDFDFILRRTVELATSLMENVDNSSRYFSHVAVREGDVILFDPHHNLPEIQGYLEASLGPGAMISLKGPRTGISGAAVNEKKPLNVPNVREHPHYVDLKKAGGSQLSVPIMLGEEVFAVLNIEHETIGAFSEQDVQTMLALSSITSSAITQKESKLTREALFNGVRALTRSYEHDRRLSAVLENVAEQAYLLLALKARKPGGFAHVGLVQGPYLVYLASYPERIIGRFAEEKYARIDLREYNTYDEHGERRRMGISGYAVITGETQNVPDVGQHPEYLKVNLDSSVGERTINSQLAVPIRLPNGDVVGVISIDHPAFGAFSDRDVQNVTLLADIASEAYRINRSNERQARALKVLREAATHIREDRGLDSILLETTVQAKQMVGREFTSEDDYTSHIALCSGDRLIFTPRHNDEKVYVAFRLAGCETVYFRGPNRSERIGIVGRVALHQKSELVHDVSKDGDYFAIRRSGTQLSVPLMVNGELYAVLSVEHTKPYSFDDDDRLTLEALAAQAGAVITILNSRLDVLRSEEGLKQREQFVANVSHELRRPITNLAAFISNLQEGNFEGPDDPEYITSLARAKHSSEDLHQIVEKLLHAARTGTEKVEIGRHDLKSLVDELIAGSMNDALKKGIDLRRISPDDAAPLFAEVDRFFIEHVVSNLLQNALRYTDRGHIHVHVWKDGDRAFVRVEDTGAGIPEDRRGAVFERMVRGDHRTAKREGLGVGLYLARQYVRLHHGEIAIVWSEIGKGTHIEFWIPLKSAVETREQT